MTGASGVMLAIDTSTEVTGIALYDDTNVSELTWRAGRNQTVSLLPQIRHLLEINRLDLDAIAAIAVATGPGTFNGLRVGLSTAKGLSYGRGLPIIGVDTLEATAYPHRSAGYPIRAFVPAGRGRVVFGDFRERNRRWMRVGEMQNRRFDELTAGLSEVTLLAGEIPDNVEREQFDSERIVLPPSAMRARRPACVAEIAYRRWAEGDTDDIAVLEPVYVHGSRSATN